MLTQTQTKVRVELKDFLTVLCLFLSDPHILYLNLPVVLTFVVVFYIFRFLVVLITISKKIQ